MRENWKNGINHTIGKEPLDFSKRSKRYVFSSLQKHKIRKHGSKKMKSGARCKTHQVYGIPDRDDIEFRKGKIDLTVYDPATAWNKGT